MTKNNKIFTIIFFVFIFLIIVISSIFIYKNLTYYKDILSIDDVIDINNKINANEKINMTYFKNFKLDNKEEKNGFTTYTYDMGSKYQFEVSVARDNKIIEMKLVNKVTYDYVNILRDSLDKFLQFD